MTDPGAERTLLWRRLATAVAAESEPPPTPMMVVDTDAFSANAADLVRRAAGKPVRLASKSVRVPELISRALSTPGFAGVLAYTLREALFLHERGICDDIVVAYPTVDRPALARLLTSPDAATAITVMVDDADQLDLLDAVRADTGSVAELRVAVDVDASLHLGRRRLGPQRSPLSDANHVQALARSIVSRPGLRLVGAMTYEGQVAGVPDQVPRERAKSFVVRRIKGASVTQLAARRAEVASVLRELADLEFWNGGGSGSIETTVADEVVTEVAAGSGLLVPGLFDHYRSFEPRPAAFFGLPVTRRPSDDTITVHGGGLIASGPTGPGRAPLPWAPPGLELTGLEGTGEVQTPLTGHPASSLAIGDLVWFRHAKSGELFEHTDRVHLLAGDAFSDSVPTYRGCGLCT